MASQENSIKHLQKSKGLLKLFQKISEEGTLPNSGHHHPDTKTKDNTKKKTTGQYH